LPVGDPFHLNTDQPAQPSGGRIAHQQMIIRIANKFQAKDEIYICWRSCCSELTSTGFLFEHGSTGATARQTDCPLVLSVSSVVKKKIDSYNSNIKTHEKYNTVFLDIPVEYLQTFILWVVVVVMLFL
jgi:hypothetical protein